MIENEATGAEKSEASRKTALNDLKTSANEETTRIYAETAVQNRTSHHQFASFAIQRQVDALFFPQGIRFDSLLQIVPFPSIPIVDQRWTFWMRQGGRGDTFPRMFLQIRDGQHHNTEETSHSSSIISPQIFPNVFHRFVISSHRCWFHFPVHSSI